MHDYNALRAALAGPFAPLAQYKQFMLWRLQPDPDGGKPRKMPIAIDGTAGSSTNPACWTDARTAIDHAERTGQGVAFVLTDNDPFVFIDVDNCASNGQWDACAQDAIARFPGAMYEASQSRRGMHLFVTGDTPQGFTGRKRGQFECYRTARYVALTGFDAQGQFFNYGDRLLSFINDKFPVVVADGDVGPLSWNPGPILEWSGPADDEELLRQFLAAPAPQSAAQAFAHLAPNAPAAVDVVVSNADLFNANATVLHRAYPSDKADPFDKSTAAFALACRLAYWTGKDCPRIERLMDRAAFRRTKADLYHSNGITYMHWDIMRACAMTTKVRYERPAVANAAVVADAASAYDAYHDRIAACGGDIHSMRAVCNEVAVDVRIDSTLRELLAGHIQQTLSVAGHKIKIDECRKLIALRSAHPAPDRQALQRQQNVSLNLPAEMVTLAPVMTTAQMLDDFVFIADGSQVGSLQDRNMTFALSDFRNMLAASTTLTPDGKTLPNTESWLTHPGRTSVMTRTFHAGGRILTHDPNGRSAINQWRPIIRGTAATCDVSPFIQHVEYLFGSDASKFLDWLAHIEQCPGVLPHFGWLHIADHFGTGRNWLESVIARLWRGYVAPSVDMDALINGGFNGALAGRVIAIVDEIRAGAREDAYMMEGKIRNMLTEETRYIKPKYGREYVEHNACRWLLFSNHKNAIPMNDNDRRWYVVHLSTAPLGEHVYAHLYSLLSHPGFIDSVGLWLRARDLSRFNPGERPPVTAAKMKAIDASKSDFQRMAGAIVKYWPGDFITASDLQSVMNEGDQQGSVRKLSAAMKHALQDVGMHYVDKQIKGMDSSRHRVWIVRNVDKWLGDLSFIATGPELEKLRLASKGTGYQTLMHFMN